MNNKLINMMNFLKYYNLIFMILCFASFSCSKSEDEEKKSNKAEITSMEFGNKTATIKGTDISITLPYGTDAANLKATAKISAGASISPDPNSPRNYTNPVDFTVTAEDGTTKKTYTVTVTVEQNTDAQITSFKFGDKTANIKGTDISITLPYGTDLKNLKAKVEVSEGARIIPDPTIAQNYENELNFIVTSKDRKTRKTYKVKVTVEKNKKAEITSFKFGDKTTTINGTNISITLPIGTDAKNLKAEAKISAGASISPDPNTPRDYTKPVDFTVTAEDGTTKQTYKVTVTVEPVLITSWQAGWRDDDAYTATIDHKTKKINIDVNSADFDTKVTLLDGATTITPDPNTITNWVNEVSFTVSKGSNRKVYKVKVTVNRRNIIKITTPKATSKTAGSLKSILKVQIGLHSNTGNFNHIDVSSVTDMSYLFYNDDATNNKFNGDISKWDVSNVTTMDNMFRKAASFNKDIGSWNVSKVGYMGYMFYRAAAFNQNIGSWNVSNVWDMSSMFSASKFI